MEIEVGSAKAKTIYILSNTFYEKSSLAARLAENNNELNFSLQYLFCLGISIGTFILRC